MSYPTRIPPLPHRTCRRKGRVWVTISKCWATPPVLINRRQTMIFPVESELAAYQDVLLFHIRCAILLIGLERRKPSSVLELSAMAWSRKAFTRRTARRGVTLRHHGERPIGKISITSCVWYFTEGRYPDRISLQQTEAVYQYAGLLDISAGRTLNKVIIGR